MAISAALVPDLPAIGPGHPPGNVPAYLDAMAAAAAEQAEAQVVVRLVRSNRTGLVVPPQRERIEF